MTFIIQYFALMQVKDYEQRQRIIKGDINIGDSEFDDFSYLDLQNQQTLKSMFSINKDYTEDEVTYEPRFTELVELKKKHTHTYGFSIKRVAHIDQEMERRKLVN